MICPIVDELREAGHRVFFSNYSFSDVKRGTPFCESCFRVDEQLPIERTTYYPEVSFAAWYHQINHHLMIDGGVDSIFRGDEFDIASPVEDTISLIAAQSASSLQSKILILSAFGSEGVGKSVSHAEVLQCLSRFIAQSKLRGISSILNNPRAAHRFADMARYLRESVCSEDWNNIVNSIDASLVGAFGDTVVTSRTNRLPIWVSPLTSLLWFLDLEAVALDKLFYSTYVELQHFDDIMNAIFRIRLNMPNGKRPSIPI